MFFAPALADVAVEHRGAVLLRDHGAGAGDDHRGARQLAAARLHRALPRPAIGLVGIDLNTGQPRLSFDIPQLADRLDIVVVAVGIFALGEALWVAAHLRRRPLEVIPVGRPWMSRDDLKRSWKPWLRGTAYRLPVRRHPRRWRGDPDVPVLRHREEARKHPDEFGHGAIEGVAGPEAANNASAAGMFVPMLALGLPSTATAAVMLAAMQGYGIQPGPQLLTDQADLVWALMASLLIGNACCWCSTSRWRRCGPSCCGSRGRTSTPGSCSSPASAPTRPTSTRSTSACCWSSACSA